MGKLVACKGCGAEISRSAPACPKCGHPGPGRSHRYGCGTLLLLLVLAFLAFAVLRTPPPVPRPPGPAPAASPAGTPDPDRGAGVSADDPSDRRRIIYAEAYRAGMRASREAEQQVPLAALPADPAASARAIAEHQRIYETLKAQGRAGVAARFGVTGAELDAIEAEGVRGRWPLPDDP
jgi:hypothetical protein